MVSVLPLKREFGIDTATYGNCGGTQPSKLAKAYGERDNKAGECMRRL